MPRSRLMNSILCGLVAAMAVTGCTSDTTSGESTGSLGLNLEVGNVEIDEVDFLITGDGMDPLGGTIDTSAPGATASVEVFGLLPGKYTVTMSATATDGETMCKGSEDFLVNADELTEVMVYLRCKLPETLGGVRVNGEFNVCAVVNESVVKPLQTSVGNDIDLSAMGEDAEGDDITYLWTGTGGDIDDPSAKATTYTCEEVGKHSVTITVSDDGFDYCMDSWTTAVTCVEGDGPECTDDEDCGLDEICVDFECVPDLECTDDEDCDEGEVCNDNNECVPDVECDENEDCDTGEICLDNKCVPDVECNDDQDCDTGFVCENFECVPDVECNENDDCDLGDICLDNVCRADPDLFCDTGLCVEDTVLRAECVDKFLLCLADNVDEEECVVLSIALCTECTEAADCPDDSNECTDAVCDAGTCGTSNNSNVCDGGAGTCSAGVCVPDAECAVDGDCPDDGNECTDAVCTAGACGTSNNTNACDGGAGTCNAGACVPNALAIYSQDFEPPMDPAAGDALILDTAAEVPLGPWLFFANVFDGGGNLKFNFGPFGAPNATADTDPSDGETFISAVVTGEGDAPQGDQQLSVFSDYNCCDRDPITGLLRQGHGNGTDLVEISVFQELNPIPNSLIGQKLTFSFDAKAGNIEGATTAVAYIQTLDPSTGFSQTNFVPVEMTLIPNTWNRYEAILDLTDPLLEGQILQIGFRSVASDFEGSGIFYDNVLATLE